MKLFLIMLLALTMGGCATSNYSYVERNADGSYVEARATLRPKDVENLDLQYGTFKLKTGQLKTASDPLAEMTAKLMPIMFCAYNPAACAAAPLTGATQ